MGKKTGKNPTDRGKLGTKRSTLTDGRGVPLAVVIAGANVHDQRLLAETLSSIPIARPRVTRQQKQHICLDAGYKGKPVLRIVRGRRYTPHVQGRSEERRSKKRGKRARRWVVERAHSWANRARRLLVRWEKKAENYLALIHLRFAYITLRAAGVMG